MMKKPLILIIVLLLLPFAVSCNSGEAVSENLSSIQDGQREQSDGPETEPSTEEISLQDKLEELREQYKDDPELFDAAVYAYHEGIEVDEAVNRMQVMNNAGPYGAALEANEPETFAGFWIRHEPTFGLTAAFTRDGEATIEKYREKYPDLVAMTEIVEMKYTLAELLDAQQEANTILKTHGLYFSSATMVKENRVEIYVTDSELFYSTLEEAGATLPECVYPVISYEPLRGVPEGLNPDDSVHFPQMKVSTGGSMAALMTGDLELTDGYLNVNGTIIIWQPDYFVNNNDGVIEVWDRDGNVVGRVGEEIKMGGGGSGPTDDLNPILKEPLPEDIEGPFWIQGTGTRLSLNFDSEWFGLRVVTSGDEKVYFLTRKPLLDETARQGITLKGKLVADYGRGIIKNPHIRTEAIPKENRTDVSYTTFWPSGYSAQIVDGVFEVIDETGTVILRDGEEAEITGEAIYSYNAQLNDELPGGFSGPYLIVESCEKP